MPLEAAVDAQPVVPENSLRSVDWRLAIPVHQEGTKPRQAKPHASNVLKIPSLRIRLRSAVIAVSRLYKFI